MILASDLYYSRTEARGREPGLWRTWNLKIWVYNMLNNGGWEN